MLGGRRRALRGVIIGLAIVSIMGGAAVPIAGKIANNKGRAATLEEMQRVSDASLEYFRDTGLVPTKITQLEENLGSQVTSEWYELKVENGLLTITSRGESAAGDLSIATDFTQARRERTLEQLKVLNQAIVLYNGSHGGTAPLPVDYEAALDILVSKGFLNRVEGHLKDAWGKPFVADPKGKSPMIKAGSVSLD